MKPQPTLSSNKRKRQLQKEDGNVPTNTNNMTLSSSHIIHKQAASNAKTTADEIATTASTTTTINQSQNPTPPTHPQRNIHQLHCPSITYLCATGQSIGSTDDASSSSSLKPHTSTACVPCAYKICNFDIARDVEFTKRVPNQRPEMCPRSSLLLMLRGNTDHGDDNVGGMMGYQRGMSVLTVGDGDFTFALAIARLVVIEGAAPTTTTTTTTQTSNTKNNEQFKKNKCGLVVATSYEDSKTLHEVYPDFDATLNSLQSFGDKSNIIVGYNVDATRLKETLPKELLRRTSSNNNPNSDNVKFHRICWNFPCTAIGNGKDGQNDAMEQNKKLVRDFMGRALSYLDEECGEIHMAHKTKPPYNQWGLDKVALEGVQQYMKERNESSSKNKNCQRRQFEFKGKVVFDKCTLPPYTPRKALDRKSFPCHDACVYVFGWKSNDAAGSPKSRPEQTLFHPTISGKSNDPSIDALLDPSLVIPVTESMVENVRLVHLQHANQKKAAGSNRNKKKSLPRDTMNGDGKHKDDKRRKIKSR